MSEYTMTNLAKTVEFDVVHRDSTREKITTSVLEEYCLRVELNGDPGFSLTCSPVGLRELVAGRLLSEGMISCREDIRSLEIDAKQRTGQVVLRQSVEPGQEILNSCGGYSVVASSGFQERMLRPVRSMAYEPQWIFKLSDALQKKLPLYLRTHSAHSCMLMQAGEILVQFEDIGRHNALDKVLGWALLHEIDLTSCILYTSGRAPVDMVAKAIRAGVPIFVSKATPTLQAVELARKYGMTMICAAHPDSYQVLR